MFIYYCSRSIVRYVDKLDIHCLLMELEFTTVFSRTYSFDGAWKHLISGLVPKILSCSHGEYTGGSEI